MAYTVNSKNKTISIADGNVNAADTSLTLIGRDRPSYGQDIAQNFVDLLQNFAGTPINSTPTNPIEGQLWYDTTTSVKLLKVYDGTTWEVLTPDMQPAVVYDTSDDFHRVTVIYDETSIISVYSTEAILLRPDNPLDPLPIHDFLYANLPGNEIKQGITLTTGNKFNGNLSGNVTGDLTGDSTGNHNGTVGATTPAAVTGTVITANTNFVGNLTGDVTGNADTATQATLADEATELKVAGVGRVATVDTAGTGTPDTIAARDGSGNLNAVLFQGQATSAQYADLAELYKSDVQYEPGTVVKIGGEAEVTQTTNALCMEVFGVVSTNPAYLMNSELSGTAVAVALEGRIPVKVIGEVRKGQRLVASEEPGVARGVSKFEHAEGDDWFRMVGRALEDKSTLGIGLVEIVVGAK